MTTLSFLPEWLAAVLMLLFYGGLLVAAIAAWRAAMVLLELAFVAACNGLQRLLIWLTEQMVKLTLVAVAVAAALVEWFVLTYIYSAWWQVCVVLHFLFDGPRLEALRQRARLRLLWHMAHRDQFPQFADFLDAVARDGLPGADKEPGTQARHEPHFGDDVPPAPPPGASPPPSPPPPAPPPAGDMVRWSQACSLLGLPWTGAFTQQDLQARYRAAIKAAHPDAGGTNERAANINAARDFIKHMKGWS